MSCFNFSLIYSSDRGKRKEDRDLGNITVNGFEVSKINIRIGEIKCNTELSLRTEVEETTKLAAKIKDQGLLNPVIYVVYCRLSNCYEAVSGNRRLQAFKYLSEQGIETLSQIESQFEVYEIKNYTDIGLLQIAIATNMLRKNATVYDKANFIRKVFESEKSLDIALLYIEKTLNIKRRRIHSYSKLLEVEEQVKELTEDLKIEKILFIQKILNIKREAGKKIDDLSTEISKLKFKNESELRRLSKSLLSKEANYEGKFHPRELSIKMNLDTYITKEEESKLKIRIGQFMEPLLEEMVLMNQFD